MTLIGLISDTHGQLRPEAATAFSGVSQILHAGDVGKPEILQELSTVAPVIAVRGNVDFGGWALKLPVQATVTVSGHRILMLHNLAELSIDAAAEGFSVVVYGHTHKPLIEARDGVLYLNPGSAGPRRFSLPISLGFLRLAENAAPEAWLQTLDL